MDVTFSPPGVESTAITVHRPVIGGIKVSVNGVPATRLRGRTLSWQIAYPDGTMHELLLKGQWMGLKAVMDGVELPLERPIPTLERGMIVMPFLLVIGGVVGALIGVGAAALNARIARAAWPRAVKAISMLGVFAGGVFTYLLVGIAAVPLEPITTGMCVNGIHAAADTPNATWRSVRCDAPHDDEIVGTTTRTDAAFPGESALFDTSQPDCANAFASYVGIDFDRSRLDMVIVVPSQITWAKGDRTVACVVFAPGGGQLQATVRGTAQ
jgi:hypothetical protein